MNQATTLAPVHARPGLEFATLSRTIRSAGLLDRRYAYYALTWAVSIVAFGGAWVAFALLGDTWWQLLVAAGLAVISTHLSFVGHDAGHRAIFRGRPANDAVGYLHGGLVGMSFGSWVAQHNAHHRNPNHETDDPDLDLPIIAFTDSQSRAKRGFARWTTKHQAFLFFPLLLLEGLNLHWEAMRSAWQGKLDRPRLERALMLVHIGAYLGAVFIVLPVPLGLAFIAVHQGLWGVYMGCSFAPNHKGMPTLTDADELDFLRKQVLTSRNAGRGRWTSFVLGGLNYQIEHHLFPSMPRPNLRRAQPLVKAFCAERGISYSECGLLASYREVLRHLHAVGAPLRQSARTAGAAGAES